MQPKARVENGTLIIKARKKEGHVRLWGSLGRPVDRKCDPKVKTRREESIKEKLKQEQEVCGGFLACLRLEASTTYNAYNHLINDHAVNVKAKLPRGQYFASQQ